MVFNTWISLKFGGKKNPQSWHYLSTCPRLHIYYINTLFQKNLPAYINITYNYITPDVLLFDFPTSTIASNLSSTQQHCNILYMGESFLMSPLCLVTCSKLLHFAQSQGSGKAVVGGEHKVLRVAVSTKGECPWHVECTGMRQWREVQWKCTWKGRT